MCARTLTGASPLCGRIRSRGENKQQAGSVAALSEVPACVAVLADHCDPPSAPAEVDPPNEQSVETASQIAPAAANGGGACLPPPLDAVVAATPEAAAGGGEEDATARPTAGGETELAPRAAWSLRDAQASYREVGRSS